jgi:hypothetical protein
MYSICMIQDFTAYAARLETTSGRHNDRSEPMPWSAKAIGEEFALAAKNSTIVLAYALHSEMLRVKGPKRLGEATLAALYPADWPSEPHQTPNFSELSCEPPDETPGVSNGT